MSNDVSTVEYLSNLQAIDTSIPNDTTYMTFVHDPFALEQMKKLIDEGRISKSMTDIQEREMRDASGHCAFAFKGDYPWGTVIIDGKKRVVCKCLNHDCSYFAQCRKGLSSFSEKEIQIDVSGIKPNEETKESSRLFENRGKEYKENLLRRDRISSRDSLGHINACDADKAFRDRDYEEGASGSAEETNNTSENCNPDEILKEFSAWMLKNDYKNTTVDGYINAIRSATLFAEKKRVWTEGIFETKSSQRINAMADKLEVSRFFKPSMSNYVTAVRVFAKYYKSLYECETEVVDSEYSSNVQDEIKSDDDKKEEFEKFVEVPQDKVILADASNRIIVNAGPGTGKTYVLIEKLVYLINEDAVDPEDILVLCFSRAAVEVIEKRLQDAFSDGKVGLNWRSIEIRTFDSFATHLLSYVQENEKGLLYNGFSLDNLDYGERIKAATDVVKKSRELIEQCRHLIVDEVQDLVAARARFVMQLIESLQEEAGYTLLGDACQSIYDYQIQQGDISSMKFYTWLFCSQTKSEFYTFGVNFRQVSELETLGNEYRKEILVGNNNSRKDVANKVFSEVDELPGIDLRKVDYHQLINIFGNKSVGILTRTNGQALKISTWFRTAEIPHKVQKKLSDNSLNVWIANVFRDYENDTIDHRTFSKLYVEGGDTCFDADTIWSEMEKTQYESKERYYVKDLLTGILNRGRTKEFYASSGDDLITISNIHRSKGREFDDIVLLDDTLFVEAQEQIDLVEHKVMYVAITRAKEKIYKTSIGKQYMKTDKNGDSRSYATGLSHSKGKKYLSHLEIGRNYDFDMSSFAENIEVQRKLDDPLHLVGERVKLIKNMDSVSKFGYVSYDIILEDDEMRFGRIGRTSRRFSTDLNRILKDVYNLPLSSDAYPSIYPRRFSEIYIDDVVSVISSATPKAVAGRKYGDIMIWKGISVAGLAQIDKDTY